MSLQPKQDVKTIKAVVYARVSSAAQVKRGHGLGSQESRCREYAGHKNYVVEKVFRDEGVSGGLIDRPGMQEMLSFLKKRKRADEYVVLIDDISRLARDIKAHVELRCAIDDAGGKLESPSIEFGEDSDSILVENLLASVSQHQRQKNAEQVVNRMKARVMAGYYVFSPPLGYSYKKLPDHGKIIVPQEPNASIVREALQGFAAGRFQSPIEVKRFLERYPSIPKNARGEVRLQLVIELLQRSLYAGYITIEKWGLHLQPGKHAPLISFNTWGKIQERLNGRANAPQRKDLNEDFPLRGFVSCGDCDHPMTAAWSKGRNAQYPYYFCQNKDCGSYRKSIRREKIESEFETILRSLQPTRKLFNLAREIFSDLWAGRLANTKAHAAISKGKATKIDAKISQLMERLLKADSPALVNAYETQITKLEEEKIRFVEQASGNGQPLKNFDEMFRTAMAFLSNPWKLWASDVLEHKRLVLRLAFPGRLAYRRNEGYRTAGIAEPFRLLRDFSTLEFGLVGPEGLEPPT